MGNKSAKDSASDVVVDTSSGARHSVRIVSFHAVHSLAAPVHCRPAADDTFTESLKLNLQRLIAYAQGTDPLIQREVAEQLANQAVKRTCCTDPVAGSWSANCHDPQQPLHCFWDFRVPRPSFADSYTLSGVDFVCVQLNGRCKLLSWGACSSCCR